MSSDFHALIRTGKLHQLHAADTALTDADIPHYLEEERSSGIRTAMPIDPMPAPGTWWVIMVPADHVQNAQDIIDQLPYTYTTNPEIWDFNPPPKFRKFIMAAVWVTLAILAIMFAQAFIQAFQ